MKKMYVPIVILLMTSFTAILSVLIVELFRGSTEY